MTKCRWPVVLTRPIERQIALGQRLRQAGCEVVELPALKLEPISPVGGDDTRAKRQAPSPFDAVVWVSRAAWQYDWDRPVYEASAQADKAALPRIMATVGLASAQVIAQALRLPPETITYPKAPALSDSEALWRQLQPQLATGARVLVVRGQSGRPWLVQTMQQAGLSVTTRAVYQRCAAIWSDESLAPLRAGQNAIWLITSLESLTAIEAQLQKHGLAGKPDVLPRAVVVVHPRLVQPVGLWLDSWGPGRASTVPVHVTDADDASLYQSLLHAAQSQGKVA